jgi:hypothetical protein
MLGRKKHKKARKRKERGGVSKTELLLGAAGLLLFIVGLKRSHRLDDESGRVLHDAPEPGSAADAAPAGAAEGRRE